MGYLLKYTPKDGDRTTLIFHWNVDFHNSCLFPTVYYMARKLGKRMRERIIDVEIQERDFFWKKANELDYDNLESLYQRLRESLKERPFSKRYFVEPKQHYEAVGQELADGGYLESSDCSGLPEADDPIFKIKPLTL